MPGAGQGGGAGDPRLQPPGLAELKATVVALREGEEAATSGPLPGLDQQGELVAMAQRGGLRVKLAVTARARLHPPG